MKDVRHGLAKVHRVAVSNGYDRGVLLALVGHDLVPQLLRAGVHEAAELRQDGRPGVVGPEHQVMVAVVRRQDCPDETLLLYAGTTYDPDTASVLVGD